jgi:hypothetical protein
VDANTYRVDANGFDVPAIERRTGSVWEKRADVTGWTITASLRTAHSEAHLRITNVKSSQADRIVLGGTTVQLLDA